MHSSGALAPAAATAWRRVDHASKRTLLSERSHLPALSDGFAAVGLQYGPGFRTLEQAWGDDGAAVARLRSRSAQQGMAVHPADLDDAFCVIPSVSGGGSGDPQVPFSVDDALLQGADGQQWAVRHSS